MSAITHYVQVQADHGAWVDHLALWDCTSDAQARDRAAKHHCQFPERRHRIIRHQKEKTMIYKTGKGFDVRYSNEEIGEHMHRRIEAVRTSGAREVLASANGYDGGDHWRINLVSGGNLGAQVSTRELAEQWLMFLADLMVRTS